MNRKLFSSAPRSMLLYVVTAACLLLLVGLLVAQATRSHFKFEAESGLRSGSTSVLDDASASGGQGLQFSATTGPSGKKCIVSLHGKGGDGGSPWVNGDTTWLFPAGNGNGDGWGPHHWEYATLTTFNQALSVINNELTPHACGQIVLIGFSNGAAMAAKTYCQGQNFNNRLVGVIVDDPVPDQGVDNCAPANGVQMKLVFSNDMNSWVGNGGFCPGGWTCQGVTYSRSNYIARIGAVNPHFSAGHSPVGDLYAGWFSPWWR